MVDQIITSAPLRSKGRHSKRIKTILLGAIPFVVLLAVWEIVGRLDIQSLRYVIPDLGAVAIALRDDIVSGSLWKHLGITLSEVFLGLLIAVPSGVILGTLIGTSKLIEKILYPIVIFFQAIPKVALAPLWLIAFGFGIGSKVALAVMVSFFPILVGVIVGMGATRREELELLQSLRASRWQIFMKVRVPRALPSTFGGLEVAVVFALIGAVVGEFVGAQGGLGYLIQFRSSRLDLPGVFSPLIVLSIIGLILDLTMKRLGHLLITWEGE